jgi:hypothetical protein
MTRQLESMPNHSLGLGPRRQHLDIGKRVARGVQHDLHWQLDAIRRVLWVDVPPLPPPAARPICPP